MDDEQVGQGRRKGRAAGSDTDRGARLKAALKANMAKRKAQARARAEKAGSDDTTDG